MIDFTDKLNDHLVTLAGTWVGAGTDPNGNYITKTIDDHLHDVAITNTPYLAIVVKDFEQSSAGEIGVDHDLYEYNVHLYYIAMNTVYNTGKVARSTILSRLVKNLEMNKRLNNFQVVDTQGGREYVFDLNVTAGNFDYIGQDQYHSFTSELYITVYTART